MANGEDEIQEEDEAVRCICGFDDYPGPPPFNEDPKIGSKDNDEIDPIFATDLTDDAAGFFVQCDVCKVWQHGACVGIMTEESSPDEYFCEECRRDLHKIFTASNGYVSSSPWRHAAVVRLCSARRSRRLALSGASSISSQARSSASSPKNAGSARIRQCAKS